jgi:hypothetical protein
VLIASAPENRHMKPATMTSILDALGTTTERAPAVVKKQGTERWPAECVANGEFFLLPKVLVKRFFKFGLRPHHLLLLLALQADRYRNRPTRHYWDNLAAWLGVSRNTVRRWGYELEKMKLVEIKLNRKRDPEDAGRIGYRNDRNEFRLEQFEERVKQEHAVWVRERPAKKNKEASEPAGG